MDAIANPKDPVFNTASETLKATAVDCISDSIATIAVLVPAIVSHLFVL